MKKIEEAAAAYDWTDGRDTSWARERPEQIKIDCFIAGARYVLNQLTSEDSINVAFLAVDVRRHECQEILAAVRKEIEGE